MEAASPAVPTQKVTGDVTVLEVGDGRRPWSSSKGGEFIGYRVKLKLHAAGDVEVGNVEVNTKADNPKFMAVGEQAFGIFDPRTGNQYGPRFQKKNPDGGGGGRRGGGGKSPEEQARIQRQHSQDMALQVAVSAGWFAGVDPALAAFGTDDPPAEAKQARQLMANLLNGPVKSLIDYFDQDIDRGAAAALKRRAEAASEGKQQTDGNQSDDRPASGG